MRVIPPFIIALMLAAGAVCAEDALFREEFDDLAGWSALTFDGIERHTSYSVDNGSLAIAVDNSASGIVFDREVDISRHPRLRWRWKIDGVYEGIDETEKPGDDYPVRISVLFVYDPDRAGAATRLKYGIYKTLHGEYPPLYALNFVWRSSVAGPVYFESPYTDRQMMIVRRSGGDLSGEWVTETVDIVDEFRNAFGFEPSNRVRIGIMGDGDNTGSVGTSHIDFIEAFRP